VCERKRENNDKGVPTWVNCSRVGAIDNGCKADQAVHSLGTWTRARWRDTWTADRADTMDPPPMCPWKNHTSHNRNLSPSTQEAGRRRRKRTKHVLHAHSFLNLFLSLSLPKTIRGERKWDTKVVMRKGWGEVFLLLPLSLCLLQICVVLRTKLSLYEFIQVWLHVFMRFHTQKRERERERDLFNFIFFILFYLFYF